MPTPRRRKLEPSLAYSKLLQDELAIINDELASAQKELYQHTATAKLGEFAFERARERCIKWTAEQRVVEKELDRVERALR